MSFSGDPFDFVRLFDVAVFTADTEIKVDFLLDFTALRFS